MEAHTKESSKETHALEVVKNEANKENEDLREAHKLFFNELNEIQQYHDNLIRLFDQADE